MEKKQYDQLRKLYITTFPAKQKALATALGEAKQQGWSPDTVNNLKTLVHRLAGSGGGYGFNELSESARSLELVIIQQLQDIDKRSVIEDALNKLSTQLEQIHEKESD